MFHGDPNLVQNIVLHINIRQFLCLHVFMFEENTLVQNNDHTTAVNKYLNEMRLR